MKTFTLPIELKLQETETDTETVIQFTTTYKKYKFKNEVLIRKHSLDQLKFAKEEHARLKKEAFMETMSAIYNKIFLK